MPSPTLVALAHAVAKRVLGDHASQYAEIALTRVVFELEYGGLSEEDAPRFVKKTVERLCTQGYAEELRGNVILAPMRDSLGYLSASHKLA